MHLRVNKPNRLFPKGISVPEAQTGLKILRNVGWVGSSASGGNSLTITGSSPPLISPYIFF